MPKQNIQEFMDQYKHIEKWKIVWATIPLMVYKAYVIAMITRIEYFL